jgi:hypothetical protein
MRGDHTANSASSTNDPATANVDVQDPLPETNWFWRRVYTFVLSLVSIGMVWYGLVALHSMNQPESIYEITRYMIGVHVLLITYYMVAPSAEQIIKIVQASKMLRSGVPVTRRATVSTPEGTRTEVETTAGHSDQPTTSETYPEPPADEERDYAPRSRT